VAAADGHDVRRPQKDARVQFEKPLPAKVMAIDGTWSYDCELIDVSESGARITLADSAAGLTEIG